LQPEVKRVAWLIAVIAVAVGAAFVLSFAGIVACQVGSAFASRVEHSSTRAIGWTTNSLLLWGIAFELAFAAALIYLPPLQTVFGTRALGLEELAVLATFPIVVWAVDELRRARGRLRM
jgi:magnesium-transporting ATPase (P-type)